MANVSNSMTELQERDKQVRPTISIEIIPFSVPNDIYLKPPVVNREDGLKQAMKVPLSEIDTASLSSLCDEFRRSIFEKAGKTDPKGI